jgi:pimeloyl-ACP methyl ester carboxylesterase
VVQAPPSTGERTTRDPRVGTLVGDRWRAHRRGMDTNPATAVTDPRAHPIQPPTVPGPRPPRWRRHRTLVAGAVGLALVAAGVPAVLTAVDDGDPAATGPAVPDLAWTACGDGVDCARADVPLDHDDPTGPQLSLALARRRATDPAHRIGTIFVNNGGPGNSVVAFVRGDVVGVLPADVQARFDVVGFDPRGVGDSMPVRCFADADEQGAFFGARPGLPVGADEIAAFTAGSADLASRCGTEAGDLLAHVSTANVARDLDLLRQAVGDEQLTYAGYSYGGLLGLTYANLYPDHVRALLLDGLPDPSGYAADDAAATAHPLSERIDSATATSSALGSFLDLCEEAGDGCSFAGTDPSVDATARFDRLMDRLAEGPVELDTPAGPFPVSYGFVVDSLRGGLQYPPVWPFIADQLQATYAAAFPGEGEQPGGVADPAAGEPAPDGAADGYDNSPEAFLAVACSETAHPSDASAWATAAAEADERVPYFGADWTWITQPCATWPAVDDDAYHGPFDATTAHPVLFLNSRFDAASNYDEAQAAAAAMPGARMLTLDGPGHPASFVPNACISAAVTAYLVDGTLPSLGATCANEVLPFG